MSKTTSRILSALGALILLYLGIVIVSSIAQLADVADRVYPGLGQPLFWVLAAIFIALLAAPIVMYYRLPKPLVAPDVDSGPEHEAFLTALRMRLQRNKALKGMTINTNADVPVALAKLSEQADQVIRNNASAIFVSTAVMQNGRLDGLIVLVTQLRMVWRIASIYYQRPSPRQMLYLYSNVGATALLSDSIQEIQFSELAAPLVASAIPSLNGAIPGMQGIATLMVNSIANGAANSFLTLRVGIVARQYCESVTRPARVSVRQSATLAALHLVGQITRENGTRIVQTSWSAVRDAVGDRVENTVQGVRTAKDKAVGATVTTAKTWRDALGSTARNLRDAAGRMSERKEPGQ